MFAPGTECYIVSRKGAEYYLRLNEPIWLAADQIFEPKYVDKYKREQMDRLDITYYVDPPLAWQGYVHGNIK